MARPNSPKVKETVRADGTTRFSTRLMVDGERVTIDLGDERDGATPLSAARKLKDVLEDIRLGRWEPPAEAKAPKREPGFAEAARMYLEVKRSRQLRSSTMNRLTWAFETHLIPFFKNRRPSRITEREVVAYTDHQIEQRNRIVQLREQDKYLAGPNGGALRPLTDATINSTLVYLTGLFTWAASNGWGDPLANPAASWRLKERPRLKAALEADELADLIEAAGTPRPLQRQRPHVAARAELIVRLRDEDGLPWKAVARRAQVAESTAIYNYQEAKRRLAGRGFDEDRAAADAVFVLVLAGTGLRVTELCDLDVGDVDLRHAKLQVLDSKTEAGVREVYLTDRLVNAITTYFKSRGPMSHDDPAFPDSNGRRRDQCQANNQVFAPATQLANSRRQERGERPLPHVTPHILRHTYISLALETGYSVPYVMQQVGHRDPRMTMRVYAKVCARRDRALQGAAFDRLLETQPVPARTHGRPASLS
jgi:integrase